MKNNKIWKILGIITNILYISLIIYLYYEVFSYEFDFVDFLWMGLILIILLLPIISLLLNIRFKNNEFLKFNIIFELVVLSLLALGEWFLWPHIKSSTNNCDWCNISTYEDK